MISVEHERKFVAMEMEFCLGRGWLQEADDKLRNSRMRALGALVELLVEETNE